VVLLIAAGLVMAATLALVFRTRLRLLPLAVALAAAGLTFGALSLAGASLTMGSIAVLPVLIGLAVDYAIQVQSRVEEARVGSPMRGEAGGGGAPPEIPAGAGAREGSASGAARRVARVGAPTVVTAAAATAAGFLVLLLSPVPMVAGFGGLLVVGVLCALALALSAGVAALVLVHDGGARAPARLAPSVRGARDVVRAVARAGHAAGRPVARWARGAAQLMQIERLAGPSRRLGGAIGGRARTGVHATLDAALRRPVRILGVALLLALAGWALDTQLEVESDVQRLVPASLPALADLEALQQASGVGGTIDVLVESDDLTDPRVVGWMADFQDRVLARAGHSTDRGCGAAPLCPAFSLTDLLGGGQDGAPAAPPDRAQIEGLLGAVPAYFTRSVISEDRRAATLSFGIRLMPLDRQQEVVEAMRAQLDPPEGVDAQLVGLPVLAAQANAEISSHPRRVLTLVAGLLAVALVLLVALRAPRRALVPLAPIVLATGWSALVLFLLRVPLNPMSVTLGALVVAISTEFSVLLSERYRAERAKGLSTSVALRATYASTGTAVLASGLTAIAGFAVLVVSDIRMLRDFGAVTVVDLGVSLLGVLVVLPAVLVVAERPQLLREGVAGAGATVARLRPRLPRLRRPSRPRRFPPRPP
ncbi:MAG TPA: MMPL family transporter, partial [Solirubrobacteraceae bacterium]|nr:MMPL family transporter [Solirubrobacteraceae bacterium]